MHIDALSSQTIPCIFSYLSIDKTITAACVTLRFFGSVRYAVQAALHAITQACQALYHKAAAILTEILQLGADNPSVLGKFKLIPPM